MSVVESAMAGGDTGYLLFVDICRSYDSLLHVTILNQLRTFGVARCIFSYIESFFCDQSFVVAPCRTVSALRNFLDRAPQVSVLSPMLFKLAMAALQSMASPNRYLAIRISIYADDVTLVCWRFNSNSSHSWDAQKVVNRGHKIGLFVSSRKVASILYRHRVRPPLSGQPLFPNGIRVARVRTHRYMDVVSNNRPRDCASIGRWPSSFFSPLENIRPLLEGITGSPTAESLESSGITIPLRTAFYVPVPQPVEQSRNFTSRSPSGAS